MHDWRVKLRGLLVKADWVKSATLAGTLSRYVRCTWAIGDWHVERPVYYHHATDSRPESYSPPRASTSCLVGFFGPRSWNETLGGR